MVAGAPDRGATFPAAVTPCAWMRDVRLACIGPRAGRGHFALWGAGFDETGATVDSSRFRLWGCSHYGLQVEVQERLLLVALFLILLAHPDHLPQYFDVEAVALGFEIDFLFAFGGLPDLLLDALDALHDGPQLITRNTLTRSAHGLLLVNLTARNSAIRAAASRRAGERGKQSINGWGRPP